jgi:hypothetical protein
MHYLVDKLINKGYNIYPEVLGFNYFNEFNPELLIGYDYVFIQSDYGIPLRYNITQFLTGAEKRYPNTYMWCCLDFSNIKQLPYSEAIDIPTVGFVGRIPFLKSATDPEKVTLHGGFEPRLAAYNILSNSSSICFDSHVRFGPYGGTNDWGFWNPDVAINSWEPLFKTNMLANTYALTARGNGNYAQRLYEAFAYGRIPVYIDSDGRMPWDTIIDYNEWDCFVSCRINEINDLESKILEFHQTHDICKCQDNCRKIYEEYLTFDKQVEIFENNVDSFNRYSG